jgi:hypothetical protein
VLFSLTDVIKSANSTFDNIVTELIIAEIADSQKKTSLTMQRHGKNISAVQNNHAATEVLLEAVFSMQSVPRLHKENQLRFSVNQVGVVSNLRQ